MPLVLALKNKQTVVVASDASTLSDGTLSYGQFLNLPGRSILLLAGDIEVVRHPIMQTVLPKLDSGTSAAALAQLLHAALLLEALPVTSQDGSHVELIVAGIDPVRHVEEPGLYFLSSATGFQLQAPPGDYLTAGSTAEAEAILRGRDLQPASVDELLSLAKECLASAKLRWPANMGNHQQFGTITPTQTRIFGY